MNCDQIMTDEIAEKYLLGALSEADKEAFEQHYFVCPRCFEELQTYRALRLELKRTAAAIRAEPAVTRIGWKWAWAAATAVVVLVIGASIWLREKGPSTPSVQTLGQQAPARQQPVEPSVPSLSELAQVQPLPYVPVTLRGPEDEARRQFRQAMRLYSKGDFQAAIAGLRSASKLDPKAPDISFFLGVCYLLTGRPDTAMNHLRATVRLGDSPYLEDAHFYLAKAYIQKRNLDAARGELRKLIELQGERKKEAQWLVEQIELLKKTQP